MSSASTKADCDSCNQRPLWINRLAISFALFGLAVSAWLIITVSIPVLQGNKSPFSEKETSPILSISTLAATIAHVEPNLIPTSEQLASPTSPTAAEISGLATEVNDQSNSENLLPVNRTPALMEVSECSAASANDSTTGLDKFAREVSYYSQHLPVSRASSTDKTRMIMRLKSLTRNSLDNTWNNIRLAQQGHQTMILIGIETTLTAPNTSIDQVGSPNQAGQAKLILQLLNQVRQGYGLESLQLDDRLTQAALLHSCDQAAHDVMSHEGSDDSQVSNRVRAQGYEYQIVGENVLSQGFIHAAMAFDSWWNSPPHRENMMNSAFTDIGIAYAESASGQLYYTMVLAAPRS